MPSASGCSIFCLLWRAARPLQPPPLPARVLLLATSAFFCASSVAIFSTRTIACNKVWPLCAYAIRPMKQGIASGKVDIFTQPAAARSPAVESGMLWCIRIRPWAA